MTEEAWHGGLIRLRNRVGGRRGTESRTEALQDFTVIRKEEASSVAAVFSGK